MKTIYIDVYFLINFTVDLLSLYFSASISKIQTTIRRLVLSSSLGGIYAVISVLLMEKSWLSAVLSPIFIILIIVIITPRVSFYRRIKYCISFVLIQIVIGGIVYYAYCTLDKLFIDFDMSGVSEVNKKLLILSLFVLVSIGALKILLLFFTKAKSEQCAEVEIVCLNRSSRVTALVDSGNMAVDPFDKSPVMFVAASVGKSLFSVEYEKISKIDGLSYDLKKRLRPIPVRSISGGGVVYAIKPDEAYIIYKDKKERIKLSVAISDEKDFFGYSALIPLSAVEDIF